MRRWSVVSPDRPMLHGAPRSAYCHRCKVAKHTAIDTHRFEDLAAELV